MTAAREKVIFDLRERIASLEGVSARKAGCLSFGVPEIDAVLPGGGLAYGALHEFAGGGAGTVDGAAAALCAAGIAARTKGPVVWCLTRPDLFFPALAEVGLHADRVIFVESDRKRTCSPIWRRGCPSAASARWSVNSSGYRWSARAACSSRPRKQEQWRSPSDAGDGRRRQMISDSRRHRPAGGGSASCRRRSCQCRVSAGPNGCWN